MSMSHKAFLFNYDLFCSEFLDILINSLKENDRKKLIYFIQLNIEEIKDPYEGLPLELSWQTTIEFADVQEYADYALTKFYDPAEDIGLDYKWRNIAEILAREFFIDSNRIMFSQQTCFSDNCFNPGRIGSYFQSFDNVKENLKIIREYLPQKPEFSDPLEDLIVILQSAIDAQKGLYVTF